MSTTQVNLVSRPATTQKNLREMVGEVLQWNPDVSTLLVETWLNTTYREVIDKRLWYGLLVRGQVQVPDIYHAGTVTLQNGSADVVGVGTEWTTQMEGRQMRTGMTEPIATITNVADATHLTLDMPWGGYDRNNVAYRIFQSIVSLGPNIKFVKQILNLRDAWGLHCHVPQEAVDAHDPRRSYVTRPMVLADYVPSATGEPQFELWPPPYVRQAFPFLAYVQPPDMKEDNDCPVMLVRSDALVKKAIAEALVHPSARANKHYDPVESARKEKQFYGAMKDMADNDENLGMTQLQWKYEEMPLAPLPWMQGAFGGSSYDRL